MAEWLKARAWKVRLPERVTGVRIPLSPPLPTSCEAAGSNEMAVSEACFGERTAHSSQGRNGRWSEMKPSPTGKADRRKVNPSLSAIADQRRSPACAYLLCLAITLHPSKPTLNQPLR